MHHWNWKIKPSSWLSVFCKGKGFAYWDIAFNPTDYFIPMRRSQRNCKYSSLSSRKLMYQEPGAYYFALLVLHHFWKFCCWLATNVSQPRLLPVSLWSTLLIARIGKVELKTAMQSLGCVLWLSFWSRARPLASLHALHASTKLPMSHWSNWVATNCSGLRVRPFMGKVSMPDGIHPKILV